MKDLKENERQNCDNDNVPFTDLAETRKHVKPQMLQRMSELQYRLLKIAMPDFATQKLEPNPELFEGEHKIKNDTKTMKRHLFSKNFLDFIHLHHLEKVIFSNKKM